jgi:hypothetical protein
MRRALAALFVSVACSASTPETVRSDAVAQASWDLWVRSPQRFVVILVVDDAPTPEAKSIRATAIAALRRTLELFRSSYAGFQYGDPAAWIPADMRVVIVHPSASSSERIKGPSDDPRLFLVSDNASIAQVDAVADAAGQAIDAYVAARDAAYPLLHTAASTVDLVLHARPPVDAHEASLLGSLGDSRWVALAIATSRDDGSDGTIDVVTDKRVATSILSPLVEQPGSCFGGLAPSTRLAAWASSMRLANVLDALCPDPMRGVAAWGLFPSGTDEGYSWCIPLRPATRPEGGAACTIDVTMADDGPCAAHTGMLDPLDGNAHRRPRALVEAGVPQRVCELIEFSGAQAEACRTTRDCNGCAAGWCLSSGWDSVPWCADRPILRFVHGAFPREQARMHVVCNIAR